MILRRRNVLMGLFGIAPAIVAAPSLMRVSAKIFGKNGIWLSEPEMTIMDVHQLAVRLWSRKLMREAIRSRGLVDELCGVTDFMRGIGPEKVLTFKVGTP